MRIHATCLKCKYKIDKELADEVDINKLAKDCEDLQKIMKEHHEKSHSEVKDSIKWRLSYPSIWERIDNKITGKSSPARWGLFSIGIATVFFVISLTFAVSSITMKTAELTLISISSFVFLLIIIAGIYWIKHPASAQAVNQRLANIEIKTNKIIQLCTPK